MPKYAHALDCGCRLCRFPESGCPACGSEWVSGFYSAVPPYEWLWQIGNYAHSTGFCPSCGARLPERGHHPDAPPTDPSLPAADETMRSLAADMLERLREFRDSQA